MVALSVSISASTSPEAILSPSFLSHLASLPSVMVGDRAGMRIWIVIASGPYEDFGVELGRIGLGTRLGELGGVRDDVAELLVERLELVVRQAGVDQQLARVIDRVMLGPDSLSSSLGRYLAGSDIEWPR